MLYSMTAFMSSNCGGSYMSTLGGAAVGGLASGLLVAAFGDDKGIAGGLSAATLIAIRLLPDDRSLDLARPRAADCRCRIRQVGIPTLELLTAYCAAAGQPRASLGSASGSGSGPLIGQSGP